MSRRVGIGLRKASGSKSTNLSYRGATLRLGGLGRPSLWDLISHLLRTQDFVLG